MDNEGTTVDARGSETGSETRDRRALVETAARHVRRSEWQAALDMYRAAEQAGAALGGPSLLLLQIARARLAGRDERAVLVAVLEPGWLADERALRDLKRLLIGPSAKAQDWALAIPAQRVLVDARPDDLGERILLARYHARLEDWGGASAALQPVAPSADVAPETQVQVLRTLLQAGAVERAAEWARCAARSASGNAELAFFVLTAFGRAKDVQAAASVVERIDPAGIEDPRLLSLMVDSHINAGKPARAIKTGEAAMAAGRDSASLRLQLARAHLAASDSRDAQTRAADHLAAARAQDSQLLRASGLLGELHLRMGRFAEATEVLRHAHGQNSESRQVRALLARALKHTGDHLESGRHFHWLAQNDEPHAPWAGYATSALVQAGRPNQARRFHEHHIARRRALVPDNLAEGLAALDEKCTAAPIPQARFDWAWSLADQARFPDRTEWERRGRWGHQADHLLFDWLECRDDRLDEMMVLLADLGAIEQQLRAVDLSRGALLVTAHIGALWAIPSILELLGRPAKWLASTPNARRTSYAGRLISTTDQNEIQVLKACLAALNTGRLVALAVDGAANPTAPRTRFLGQSINYSNFAARMAHRSQTPSFFLAPQWRDGMITSVLMPLPMPEADEEVVSFVLRWREAYLAHVEACLRGSPENLRLAGGLWRHVRSA